MKKLITRLIIVSISLFFYSCKDKKEIHLEGFLGIPVGVQLKSLETYIDSLKKNKTLVPDKNGNLYHTRIMVDNFNQNYYYFFPVYEQQNGFVTSVTVFLSTDLDNPPFFKPSEITNWYNMYYFFYKDYEFKVHDMPFGIKDTLHVVDYEYPSGFRVENKIKTMLGNLYGEPIREDTVKNSTILGDYERISKIWTTPQGLDISFDVEQNTSMRSHNYAQQKYKVITDKLQRDCSMSIRYSLNEELRNKLPKKKVF